MTDYRVTRGSGLDLFMRGKGFQQWRILALVNCGGVKIISEGKEITLKRAEKTHVDVDDIVRVPDPLPKGCQQAIQNEVKTNSRDYAFVPGQSGPEKNNAALLHTRPQTILFNDQISKDPNVQDSFVGDDLAQFIKAFERSAVIRNPVRHLIVISHSTPEGRLSIQMGSSADVTFEDLEAAAKSNSIVVDDSKLQPRPVDKSGTALPIQFIFGGCRIGTQPVFLRKLKQALGNKVTVIAPKHFHEVGYFKKPPGWLEFMGYSFRINRPKRLKTKAAVIAEMIAEGFTTIDGQPVLNKAWKTWVPDRPEKKYEQSFGEPVFNPITKSNVSASGVFRFYVRQLFTRSNKLPIKKDTGKEKDRKDAIKAFLLQRDDFKSTHPFPQYERYGYKTIDEFMDGWEWEIKPKKPASEIEWNAKRYEYTAIPPITRGKKKELVLNYYPTTKKGSIIELLDVKDKDFFATV